MAMTALHRQLYHGPGAAQRQPRHALSHPLIMPLFNAVGREGVAEQDWRGQWRGQCRVVRDL